MIVDDNEIILILDWIQSILQFHLLDAVTCVKHLFLQYEQILPGRYDIQVFKLRRMDTLLISLLFSEKLADPVQFQIVCKEPLG